jgi:hypothetical protein
MRRRCASRAGASFSRSPHRASGDHARDPRAVDRRVDDDATSLRVHRPHAAESQRLAAGAVHAHQESLDETGAFGLSRRAPLHALERDLHRRRRRHVLRERAVAVQPTLRGSPARGGRGGRDAEDGRALPGFERPRHRLALVAALDDEHEVGIGRADLRPLEGDAEPALHQAARVDDDVREARRQRAAHEPPGGVRGVRDVADGRGVADELQGQQRGVA